MKRNEEAQMYRSEKVISLGDLSFECGFANHKSIQTDSNGFEHPIRSWHPNPMTFRKGKPPKEAIDGVKNNVLWYVGMKRSFTP
jgi:hypothetical protein